MDVRNTYDTFRKNLLEYVDIMPTNPRFAGVTKAEFAELETVRANTRKPKKLRVRAENHPMFRPIDGEAPRPTNPPQSGF